jgi:hypothetical protein
MSPTLADDRAHTQDNLDQLDVVACLAATGMAVADMRVRTTIRGRGLAKADEQLA